jgi:hypothetical protein
MLMLNLTPVEVVNLAEGYKELRLPVWFVFLAL